MQQKLRYLKIAHWCHSISRLRTGATHSRDCVNPVRNLKIGTQFRDSENVQRNLEIVQIPKLRGTYTCFTLVQHTMCCAGYVQMA